ncbi:glutathione transferase GstA [Sphingobium cloacae]|uniref:Glutathione S-transferase n=1 Tax=Sphingobium cloacae TaxID=120107 RepID=A0A1E1F1R7_9SPHN|nr:glutathione transferase GstA [Sphingobium cloacae]BAV64463.1 glutathione S-transferase [Sphingobium cloacae]
MKLYYAPYACSLAVHIVALEAGVSLDLVKVDLDGYTLPDGSDYRSVNPRGYVPVLEFDDGERLTETAVLVQYLADSGSHRELLPAFGTRERLRAQSWLNVIATELHKTFSWLWRDDTPEETRQIVRAKLADRFAELDGLLAAQPFLTGTQFTVVDAYAFTVVDWANHVDIDLSAYPNLSAFMVRVGDRPSVQAALREEGE